MIKGWKTLAFGLLLAVGPQALDFLGATDFTKLGLSPNVASLLGAIVMVLRVMTTSAVGKKAFIALPIAGLLALGACTQPPMPVTSGAMAVAGDVGPAIAQTKAAVAALKGNGSMLSKGAALACAAQADANLATAAATEAGTPALMSWWSKLSGMVGMLCAW